MGDHRRGRERTHPRPRCVPRFLRSPFPRVLERGDGKTNHSDVDDLRKRLRAAVQPIKEHRDTVVAHWDDDPRPATWEQLDVAVATVEETLKDLYFACTFGNLEWKIGYSADPDIVAAQLADIMLRWPHQAAPRSAAQ